MIGLLHISILTGNYISDSVNSYSTRFPGVHRIQIINYQSDIRIFLDVLVFSRFDKVHSTNVKILTIKIETHGHNIWLDRTFSWCCCCSTYPCKGAVILLCLFLRKHCVRHCCCYPLLCWVPQIQDSSLRSIIIFTISTHLRMVGNLVLTNSFWMSCFVSEFTPGVLWLTSYRYLFHMYLLYVSWYVIVLACLYCRANLNGALHQHDKLVLWKLWARWIQ